MDSKPKVTLSGEDGNAFMIIGLCARAAKKAKWDDKKWTSVREETMSGDYNKVLATACKYFNVY